MTLSPPIADATAPPFVDGRKVLCNGKVEPWTGAVQEVFAPIYKPDSEEKVLIGYQACPPSPAHHPLASPSGRSGVALGVLRPSPMVALKGKAEMRFRIPGSWKDRWITRA